MKAEVPKSGDPGDGSASGASSPEKDMFGVPKNLEMVNAFPSSIGIAVPKETPIVDVDISQLCRLLSVFGTSVAQLHEAHAKPPAWMEEITSRLERVGFLDGAFTTLTEVVSNVLAVAQITGDPRAKKASADLEELTRSASELRGRESDWSREPFQIQDIFAVKSRVIGLEKRVAVAPSCDDIKNLKEYITDRARQLKSMVVTIQSHMERQFDVRAKEHIENFGKWQKDLTEVSNGRLRLLTEQLEEAQNDLEQVRELTNAEIRDVENLSRESREQTARELATCNSQLLSLQLTIDKVLERVGTVESKASEQRMAFEAFILSTNTIFEKNNHELENLGTHLEIVECRAVEIAKSLHQETLRVGELTGKLSDLDHLVEEQAKLLREQKKQSDRQLCGIRNVESHLGDLSKRLQTRELYIDERLKSQSSDLGDLALQVKATRSERGVLDEEVKELVKTISYYPEKLHALEESLEALRDHTEQEIEDRNALEANLNQIQTIKCDILLLRDEMCEMIDQKAKYLADRMAEDLSRINKLQSDFANRVGDVDVAQVVADVADLTTNLKDATAAAADRTKGTEAILNDLQQKVENLEKAQARIGESIMPCAPGMGSRGTSEAKRLQSPNLRQRNGTMNEWQGGLHRQRQIGSSESMSKIRSDGSSSTFAQLPPVAQATAIDRMQLVQNEAVGLAQICFRYECMCVEKNYLCKFPEDVVNAISTSSMTMAAFIAEKIDFWAIVQSIGDDDDGTASACTDLGDDELKSKRKDECIEWLRVVHDEILGLVSFAGMKPTPLQTKARERVFSRIRRALELCLAKHDSVFIMQSSGFTSTGKTVPTCVACDRPLPKRTRARVGSSQEDANCLEKGSTQPIASESTAKGGTTYVRGGGFRIPRKHDPGDAHTAQSTRSPTKDSPAQADAHADVVQGDRGSIDSWSDEWN